MPTAEHGDMHPLSRHRQTAQQRWEEDQQSIESARSSVSSLQQDIERELKAMKVGASLAPAVADVIACIADALPQRGMHPKQ